MNQHASIAAKCLTAALVLLAISVPAAAAGPAPASPKVSDLAGRRAQLVEEITKAARVYLPLHPVMLRLQRELDILDGKLATSDPTPRVRGVEALRVALVERRIPEVSYPELPLSEVITLLYEDLRKADPRRRTIDLLLDPRAQPLAGFAGAELKDVTVHINQPLRDLRGVDVLEAIVKSASAPLEYYVSPAGVIFRFRNRPVMAGRGPAGPTPEQQALRKRMEGIVFPDFVVPRVPLGAVIRILSADARRLAPDKQGVNFLLAPYFPDPPGWTNPPAGPPRIPVLDARGNPVANPPPAAGHQVEDLETVIIDVQPARKNASLVEVLDAVVRNSSRPLAWRLEDFGVLFTPRYDAAKAGAGAGKAE